MALGRVAVGSTTRQRMAPNTVGPVSVALMCRPLDGDAGELVVPQSLYALKDRKRGWRPGDPVSVEIKGVVVACRMTRWRGLVRVADVDGRTDMVRRWTLTRASAELLTREAGFQKIIELEQTRADPRQASSEQTAGDRRTTVGDLVEQTLSTPGFAK